MKHYILIAASVLALVACASTGGGIDQSDMGLGDDAVFTTPIPLDAQYASIKAGESDLIEPAYNTLPPEIPHITQKYLPITMQENGCIECHDRYRKIDNPLAYKKGKKIPMPRSHYGGFAGKGIVDEVSGARYTCVQCHVQASDATPLVDNTF